MTVRKTLGGKSIERDVARLRPLVGPASGAGGAGVPTSRTLTAGAGLTGGGDLSADRTFDLGTPGSTTVSSTNTAGADSHTHAAASSSNPGAASSLLASDVSGYLQLLRLGLGTAPSYPLHVAGATEQARIGYDGSNYASLTVDSGGGLSLATATSGAGGNFTVAPAGDVLFNPTGNDVYPSSNYDLNLGLINKKWLTLHASELWVETLVAQETIATIGGRVLVGPTNVFAADFLSGSTGSGTAPAYVAGTAAMNASGTAHIYPVPAGAQEDDVLVAHVVTTGGTVSCTGWTVIVSTNHASASLRSTVLYKVAGASEPADYTFTVSAANIGAGGIVAVRNVDTADVVDAYSGTTSASDATIEASSVTSTVNNAMLLFLGATAGSAGYYVTPPAGMAEAWDQFHASGGVSSELAYVLQTAPGASGAKEATIWQTGGSGASGTTYATPALVQAVVNTGSSLDSIATTFDSEVTAGNLITVGMVTWGADAGANVMSDNQHNIYNQAGGVLTSGSARMELVYAYNAAGGPTTVTVNPPGGGADITVVLAEWSGVQSSADPYDVTASTSGSGTAVNSGTAATTALANELVIGLMTHATGGSPAITTGSGYSQAAEEEESDSGMPIALEYKTVTAAAGYAATWTTGGSVDWIARVATFKAGEGSGAALPFPQSDRVTAAAFDESGTARYFGPHANENGSDLWPVTWHDDGNLYFAYGDGYGAEGTIRASHGVTRIAQTPPTALTGTDLATDEGKCNAGIISIGGTIYVYLQEQNAWTRCALLTSTDDGATFTDTGWLFDENTGDLDGMFADPAVVNYGQDFAGAPDSYVYLYGRRQYTDGDNLYLARCSKHNLATRASYEFYDGSGWSADITDAAAVFTLAGLDWGFSAWYHPATQRYWLMCRHNDTGGWGIYDSDNPYGPWTTVFYKPSGWIDTTTKFSFHFTQKWMDAAGTALYMAFSGVDDYDSLNVIPLALTLATPLPASAYSTGQLVALKSTVSLPVFTVKYNNLVAGDVVYCEAAGKVEFMRVESAAGGTTGAYTYDVTRNLDGTGANDWYAGDAVFNTGQVGDGFIDLYSVRGIKSASQYGPTIAGNVRNSATYNDWTEHWAIGNLNGLYGYGSDAYGFAAGKYSGTTSWISADAVNGFRVMYGTTVLGQWDVNGDFTLGQVATNKANLFWDNSAGRLYFRGGAGGTGQNMYLDAAGSLVFATSPSDLTSYIRWADGGFIHLRDRRASGYGLMLRMAIGTTLSPAQPTEMELRATGTGGRTSYVYLDPIAGPDRESRVVISTEYGATGSSVTLLSDYNDTGSGLVWVAPDLYVEDNCSAASYTDRTPHLDLETARAAVRSVRGRGGRLDHASLHPALRAGGGRNLSAAVSALMEVAGDLIGRVEKLERK